METLALWQQNRLMLTEPHIQGSPVALRSKLRTEIADPIG